jgi:hypothetical protein
MRAETCGLPMQSLTILEKNITKERKVAGLALWKIVTALRNYVTANRA